MSPACLANIGCGGMPDHRLFFCGSESHLSARLQEAISGFNSEHQSLEHRVRVRLRITRKNSAGHQPLYRRQEKHQAGAKDVEIDQYEFITNVGFAKAENELPSSFDTNPTQISRTFAATACPSHVARKTAA